MKKIIAAIAVIVTTKFLLACASTGLAVEDRNSLHDIQLATARAYSLVDAGDAASPERAFDRAAFCSATAVLRRNGADASAYDVKGAIDCAPVGRQ